MISFFPPCSKILTENPIYVYMCLFDKEKEGQFHPLPRAVNYFYLLL